MNMISTYILNSITCTYWHTKSNFWVALCTPGKYIVSYSTGVNKYIGLNIPIRLDTSNLLEI